MTPDDRSRRQFLAEVAAAAGAMGLGVPFLSSLPTGVRPLFAQDAELLSRFGKEGLTLLTEKPLTAETPAHLLDDDVTPTSRMFVRNNGLFPEIGAEPWTLEIAGESIIEPRFFTLEELQRGFDEVTLQLQLECTGNGRSEYDPPARGNQWTTGAVACPLWTGVRLRDVLAQCEVADDAVYVAYYGADPHSSGEPGKVPISRGVPMAKALEEETLLAWGMNAEPLPFVHGGPLRLVCGGWPGSVSGKWLQRLVVRDRVHDGPKMTGQSYRVPCEPVAPGTVVPDGQMCIVESMPVKSLVTSPQSGIVHEGPARELDVRGHAWAGDLEVEAVHVSLDFGATWKATQLRAPRNRLAWQRFSTSVTFPLPGYYEIWARATDRRGTSQPMVVPGWNPRGYLNNACHRVAVRVTEA